MCQSGVKLEGVKGQSNLFMIQKDPLNMRGLVGGQR